MAIRVCGVIRTCPGEPEFRVWLFDGRDEASTFAGSHNIGRHVSRVVASGTAVQTAVAYW